MAATKTLAELRAMVRELADQETNAPTVAFVDDTELDARINEGLKRLYDLLIQSRGQEYYATATTWATVASQSAYALPADFYSILGVRVTDGSVETEVPTWEYRELASLKQRELTGGATSLYEYRYRLKAANIVVHPYPTVTTHTLHMDYVPAFSELELDTDTFDGVNGWEKWAALTAAIDMATKEENYELVQVLVGQRGAIQAQIEALASERDGSNAPRMQDTMLGWDELDRPWWYNLEPLN